MIHVDGRTSARRTEKQRRDESLDRLLGTSAV
jgi:hypothetical protein